MPTIATSVYLIAIAADQYVSEAKFVVRGPASQASGGLTSILQSAGMARAQEDTYAVQDFIVSRDALSELIGTQGLRQVFSRPEADPLSRFPFSLGDANFLRDTPFEGGATFEHFYKYYKNHIDVSLDSTTGVSTLTVQTFRPDDSKRIATALLSSAENLINRMNERERENALRESRKEVDLAEQQVEAVGAQIAEYRNREALLDPNKQSIPMLQGINDMQTMLSRTNLQLSQLVLSSPSSPLIPDYKRRISALQAQIADAKAKITGTDQSLVPKITVYDRLSLQREFADKQLASTIASLEQARMQATRQQLYLDLIVNPNLADYPAYPKKLATIAVVFATMAGVYLMLALLIAGAREHRAV
jgi:capsular polysaccharide transport system permease protein